MCQILVEYYIIVQEFKKIQSLAITTFQNLLVLFYFLDNNNNINNEGD